MCKTLKNSRMRLDCLLWIGYTIRILLENEKSGGNTPSSLHNFEISTAKDEKISEDLLNSFQSIIIEALEAAYEISKKLKETSLSQELLCHLGIVKGNMSLSSYANEHMTTIAKTGIIFSCYYVECMYGDTSDSDEEAIEGEEEEKEPIEPDDFDVLEDLPVGEAFM